MPSVPVLKVEDLVKTIPGNEVMTVVVLSLGLGVSLGSPGLVVSDVSLTIVPSGAVPTAIALFTTSPASISACVSR